MKKYSLFLLLFCTFSCSSSFVKKDAKDVTTETGIKVAVVNFRVEGGQSLSQHIKRIEDIAHRASKAKASYILLPELTVFDLMPVNLSDDLTVHELQKLAALAPRYHENLAKISQKFRLNIIGASVVIKSGKHFLNRAFFIDSQGKVQFQDKLRPTPWESRYKFKGESSVKLFRSPDFSFVILICHDAEFPDISQNLGKLRPEVIFVPSMTDDEFGLNRVKLTSSARAIEHMSYVLMTGTSARADAPWHAYEGRNHFFVPQNKYFADIRSPISSSEESISFYHLDLAKLKAARLDVKQVYPARDMKK